MWSVPKSLSRPPRHGRIRIACNPTERDRRGSILVLAAAILVVIFAMVAFSVDMSYIALTKTQLQIAADGAALAGCLELRDGLGPQPINTTMETMSISGAAATAVAGANRNGDLTATYLSVQRDLQFGQAVWDENSQRWTTNWGAAPYNCVRVIACRNSDESPNGDRPLEMMFAPVMGIDTASLSTSATAALLPGVGFKISSGSAGTIDVLPIALDVGTWEALINGTGSDDYSYNPSTGAVTSGGDGILEVDLYPYGNGALPPGNRGTVDLGSPNNSTNDLKRQILYGLNAYDLSFFGGELRTDEGNLILNGDTGISAGIKAELEQIKGRPRLIPLFTQVSGPGNNAMYTVPKFVGIRIMYVKLTGGTKKVVVQPAPFVSPNVIRGESVVRPDSYFTPPRLIN